MPDLFRVAKRVSLSILRKDFPRREKITCGVAADFTLLTARVAVNLAPGRHRRKKGRFPPCYRARNKPSRQRLTATDDADLRKQSRECSRARATSWRCFRLRLVAFARTDRLREEKGRGEGRHFATPLRSDVTVCANSRRSARRGVFSPPSR
jgi:hypothetical protein